MSDADSSGEYGAVLNRLGEEFSGLFSPETIERLVSDSQQRWSDARIHAFVPLLHERFMRETLRAAAQAESSS